MIKRSTKMRVVYIKGKEINTVKRVKVRRPTARQIREERLYRLIYRMELNSYRGFLRDHADRIAEIKKSDPDWELPKPTLADVKLRYPLRGK